MTGAKINRNSLIDKTKLVMAFLVIGIHSSLLIDISSFSYFVLVNGIFRISVPFFFLVSGYYFFNSQSTGMTLVWFKRVFILYVFWMLIYSPFWLDYADFNLFNVIKAFKTVIFGYHHLWFLSALIGAGLLVWLMIRYGIDLKFPSIILFLIGVCIQYLLNYNFNAFPFANDFNQGSLLFLFRNFIFFGFPFFSLGFLIASKEIKIALEPKWLIGIGLLLLIVESMFNFFLLGYQYGFDTYMSLPLSVLGLFLFCTKTEAKVTTNSRKINYSLYSTALYFIHPLVLYFLSQLGVVGSSLVKFTYCVVLTTILGSFVMLARFRFKFIL
ncbi:acyltransferase family protein [Vibrio sp. 1978]|uniref:acyltransferase family protein n=1 Tax=Vibrio sp. 1978 TaxID=3074585 RepID=UPI0029672A6F|nr:acyltransferase family protein [Vibrio sp. 1978]MDW3056451.1 acyltransferase family protein [Vibrio sp. 1978]